MSKPFIERLRPLLGLVFPRHCVCCGSSDPEGFHYICWDCWLSTARVEPPFCDLCGDPVAGSIDHDFICYSCSVEKPAFNAARSAARYDGVVGLGLRQLKYQKATWMVADLTQLMTYCVQAEYAGVNFDFVVPVPLFHTRRRMRGFNQAALLAHALAREIQTTCLPHAVKRILPTLTQTNLTAPERLRNVCGAFKANKKVCKELKGKDLLLVDDIMTTGATVNACAKALKSGGAKSVFVITVARG